ncbi:plasma membrane snare protein-like protein [Saccharata proteae CBS 121410]|uniref:Protein transport protein SEC9 n=1 Tax=Saccharata proteae CBS 121410 TaxID=1314787 RepID=A0A9P4HZX6_9PEZI|nr:plasma membrane snare protein-like protein [Saccharata proteae CBS 121410]
MGLFSKKDKAAGGEDDSANRSALFGSRKEKSSPAPNANPYAQPAGKPDPYAQKAPPPYSAGGPSDSFRNDKSPVPPGGYSGSGNYGNNAAYGQDRFGSGSASPAPSARPGGYGGLGRSNSQETFSTDVGRQELFGNAAQRVQQAPPQSDPSGAYGDSGAYGSGSATDQGYGAYADRQLTAEEEEEEDVQASKQQIRFMKQQDVSSTRNALRLAAQAEESGRDTLGRLGAQGERIHNTERNLDLAANQNRLAEEKARELKTLNKSMFAMHVSNPFTASSRRAARDEAIMDTHHRERQQREATRSAAFDSSQRQQQFQRELRGGPGGTGKASLAERSKYQFEADSEDDEMENEIDSNLDALHGAAGRLKGLAGAMGKEVDEQNTHISRITGKTDRVDDQIAMNRARLDRIK